MQQKALAWSVRAFGTGCIAITPKGVEGLKDRPRTGRKPLLDGDQLLELDQIVQTQPDPLKDGVVRWRCCDLKIRIKNQFDVEISERSVGRILRSRKFRRLSPRPKHPNADEASQASFKQIFPGSYGKACQSMPRASQSKSGSKTRLA
jgi:transposase